MREFPAGLAEDGWSGLYVREKELAFWTPVAPERNGSFFGYLPSLARGSPGGIDDSFFPMRLKPNVTYFTIRNAGNVVWL
jgi:hypothetical protein